MAKMGDIALKVDKFITDTRLLKCYKSGACCFGTKDSFDCEFKSIVINEKGECANCVPIENTVPMVTEEAYNDT